MKALVLLSASLFSSIALASWQNIEVTGKVVDEQNEPIKATVQLAGTTITTDKNGNFTAKLAGKSNYQFNLTANGYYNKVHDFSHSELTQGNDLEFVLVEQKPGRVMMAFGGDLMMTRRYYSPHFDEPALLHEGSILEDSKKLLAPIKPYLTMADMAAINLETQIAETEPTQKADKGIRFYSKPETIEALQWAGVDYVTLGNNHTYDFLDEGLISTIKALDDYKLSHSGAGLNEQEALKPYVYKTDKADYAMLGYVGWEGTKAIKQAATSKQGGPAFGSEKNIVQSVKQANANKQKAVIQFHGSMEYSNEPTVLTEQRLKSGLDAGAVLAIAHHPHVSQGLELYDNKLIAYSMGNFLFDQYFSSTQLSLLLYVWLDEGKFHRAEIVPIYVKGYKPTPAMDLERDNLLKRLTWLSAKRNTQIVTQAGHGVITGKFQDKSLAEVKVLANNAKTHLITTAEAGALIEKIKLPKDVKAYRLGTNLVNGSDFEQFDTFDTNERGFAFDPSKVEIGQTGFESSKSLAVQLSGKDKTEVAMKYFRRVYLNDTPVTFKTDVMVNQDVTLNLYWQGRKTRQKLFDAFENSPKNLISSVELTADKKWQPVEIDFNSPRIGYRSYRVIAELVSKSSGKTVAHIDNFSLVQWHTAYQNSEKPILTDNGGKMVNYIGVSNTSNKPIEVMLK